MLSFRKMASYKFFEAMNKTIPVYVKSEDFYPF